MRMRNRMKKRGDLREQVPEIIIAVLCLILIVIAGVMIYKLFANQEEENAKKTADIIEGRINALKDGQSNNFIVQGFKGADNWFLVGWSKTEDGRPDKCFFDSCICICKGDLSRLKSGQDESLNNKCTDLGFCRKFSVDKVSVEREVLVGSLKDINPETGQSSEKPEKRICTGIGLKQNLMQISMSKSKDEIKILYESDEPPNDNQACF